MFRAFEIAKKVLVSDGFLLTVDLNVHCKEVERLFSHDFVLIYRVEDPIQTMSLWRKRIPVSGIKDFY